MEDIFKGPVFDFLINESINNRGGWGGNAGSIDGISEEDLENSRKGNLFMREFLSKAEPFNILETGTNYGSFSYTCYETLQDFKLWTCDNVDNDNSKRCIDFINNHYNDNKVKFYKENSREFLLALQKTDIKFNLAWLDATHSYHALIEELKIVASMNVDYIMVDDFWSQRELQMAVFNFLHENNEYRFHSFSNLRTNVGSIIILVNTGEGQNLNFSVDDYSQKINYDEDDK